MNKPGRNPYRALLKLSSCFALLLGSCQAPVQNPYISGEQVQVKFDDHAVTSYISAWGDTTPLTILDGVLKSTQGEFEFRMTNASVMNSPGGSAVSSMWRVDPVPSADSVVNLAELIQLGLKQAMWTTDSRSNQEWLSFAGAVSFEDEALSDVKLIIQVRVDEALNQMRWPDCSL